MSISFVELCDTASLLDGPLVVAVIELSVIVDPIHRRSDWNDDFVAPIAGPVQQLCCLGDLEGVVVGHLEAGAVDLKFGGKCAGIGVDRRRGSRRGCGGGGDRG